MKPSVDQMNRIFLDWSMSCGPLTIAKQLNLSAHTVIREYLRLDERYEGVA